jgi:hypothetical protein
MVDSRLIPGIAAFLVAFAASIKLPAQTEPATQPAQDAYAIYMRAGGLLRPDNAKNIMAPAASPVHFPEYPPNSDQWVRMEKQDYDLHAQVRELVHEAGLLAHANWPPFDRQHPNFDYLNNLRNTANEIADAAVYQSVILKNQPAAFASIGDLLNLANLLKNQPGENLARMLLGVGIEDIAANRLLIITAGVTITEDPANKNDLPLATATQWVARLLDHPTAEAELEQAIQGEGMPVWAVIVLTTNSSLSHLRQNIHKVQTERDFAAMSLTAHVYRDKLGRWPQNLQELSTELPRAPVDPWGDGKQTLGYVLIAGGLPDGSDRPLVYSRDGVTRQLFFRTDGPCYSFAPSSEGGQFRDVAGWSRAENHPQPTTQPTTQPLRQEGAVTTLPSHP